MATKEPALLVVLLEPQESRWWAAGISLEGEPFPLLRSEPGNLQNYAGLPFDEQVSFLRHRLSGVLQRGCDRLWGLMKKPKQIVFIADGQFPNATPELTSRVAEHFALWMTSPPVAFLQTSARFSDRPLPFALIAGELPPPDWATIETAWAQLMEQMRAAEDWELVAKNKQKGC